MLASAYFGLHNPLRGGGLRRTPGGRSVVAAWRAVATTEQKADMSRSIEARRRRYRRHRRAYEALRKGDGTVVAAKAAAARARYHADIERGRARNRLAMAAWRAAHPKENAEIQRRAHRVYYAAHHAAKREGAPS